MVQATIRNVVIISPNESLSYNGDTDETLGTGSFDYLFCLYSWTAFKKASLGGNTTCLHIYGAQIDRNVYLQFTNHTFEAEEDLELACVFLEPPLAIEEPQSTNDRGFTMETAQVMTGISELDSPDGGTIIVHEDPLEYHVRLAGYDETGTFTTPNGGLLHYRVISGNPKTARGDPVQSNTITRTKIIVREQSTRRRLYFTVDRSTFNETEDMATAQYLFQGVLGKEAAFAKAYNEEDLSRLLTVYKDVISGPASIASMTPINQSPSSGSLKISLSAIAELESRPSSPVKTKPVVPPRYPPSCYRTVIH